MDIVARLRMWAEWDYMTESASADLVIAANKIERLREALADIANIVNPYEDGDTMQEIARAALKEKE